MFPLRLQNNLSVSFKAVLSDQSWLWHLRFGHLSFSGLNLLHRKNMVNGLSLIEQPNKLCGGCILGKQHRESYHVGKSYRARSPLEIVHSDLCGYMQTPSIGNSLYFITFIDDYYRKTWVYFLKQKLEAFEVFKQFKVMVEKKSGHYIKILRIDRGEEFASNDFLSFCKTNGIKRQFTTSYTPQQNGIVERKKEQ